MEVFNSFYIYHLVAFLKKDIRTR